MVAEGHKNNVVHLAMIERSRAKPHVYSTWLHSRDFSNSRNKSLEA